MDQNSQNERKSKASQQSRREKKALKGSLLKTNKGSTPSESELRQRLDKAKEMHSKIQEQLETLFNKMGITPDKRAEYLASLEKKSPGFLKALTEERMKWEKLLGKDPEKEQVKKRQQEQSETNRHMKSLKLSARKRNWISMR